MPATLVDWIGAVARAQARRPAVHGDGGLQWSYGELWERAGGIARHLLRERAGLDLAATAPLPGYGRRPGHGEDLRPSVQGASLAKELHVASVLVGHSASC